MNISSFGRRILQAADATIFGTILGLGTAAYKNTGTSGNNVPLLDGANTWSAIQTFSANPSVAGGAISFPATQVASAGANDLDDYEEGTWTPTLTFGGGSTGITYAFRSGTYVKIGSEVIVEMQINLTAKGSSTGNMLITGLPFTPSVNSGAAVGQYGTFAGNYNLQASIGTTGVTVYQMGTAASSTVLTDANFTNTTFIIISSHYRV